jgi:hypothetical protein
MAVYTELHPEVSAEEGQVLEFMLFDVTLEVRTRRLQPSRTARTDPRAEEPHPVREIITGQMVIYSSIASICLWLPTILPLPPLTAAIGGRYLAEPRP